MGRYEGNVETDVLLEYTELVHIIMTEKVNETF